ncbi:hypothetical protein APHAL10511_008745 [Amanita phalloides]|nr:hypothetical protein APHAL10511_008745 [Amanita phalloides]
MVARRTRQRHAQEQRRLEQQQAHQRFMGAAGSQSIARVTPTFPAPRVAIQLPEPGYSTDFHMNEDENQSSDKGGCTSTSDMNMNDSFSALEHHGRLQPLDAGAGMAAENNLQSSLGPPHDGGRRDDNRPTTPTDQPGSQGQAGRPLMLLPSSDTIHLREIKNSLKFVELLQSASLEYDGFDSEDLNRLRNPPQEQLKIDDPDLRLSLDIFFATMNASQDTYNSVWNAILRRYPDNGILSFDQVKRRTRQLSGVIPLVFDMCVNTCMAYTGPYKDMESCPFCCAPRYEPPERFAPRRKKAQQEFYTIPLGPQLQAMWRQPSSADQMRYRQRCTDAIISELSKSHGVINVYDDIYTGSDYLGCVERKEICPGDMVLLFSIDGAQLYRSKKSDCWIYIWVVLDQSLKQCYKKKNILPGGFVPGPNNPKDLNSFMFPGLHHLSAVQKEGLKIWDAANNTTFISWPTLAFVTADAVAMASLCSWVGHHGKYGCHLLCGLKG